MKKRIVALVLAILTGLMTLSLTGCGPKSDIDYVKEKGELVVGITDFEPMDYQDKSGNWIGFDADMATVFAESLGVKIKFIEIEWDNKILELQNRSIDCVWNGMTLNDEVKASMECSKPYCNNAQTVIVNKADAGKYKTVEACKGLTFAVEAGSAGEKEATASGFKVVPVKDQATALMEVKSGTCNATVIDKLMAAAMVGDGTAYSDLTYTIDLNAEEYGVGFRKGSELAEELNKFLDEKSADGTMKKIAEKYGVQAALIK